jgi:hypothetical protein
MINHKDNKDGNTAFDIAQKVLAETRKNFPLGSDNILPIQKTSEKILVNQGLFSKQHSQNLDALLDVKIPSIAKKNITKLRKEIDLLLIETKDTPLEERRFIIRTAIAKEASKLGAGNCEEMATFAFLECVKIFSGKVEFVAFEKENRSWESSNNSEYILSNILNPSVDHVFVVLNRPEDSDPSDWRTWKEAVVVDPWINQAFHAEEMRKIWENNIWNVNPEKMKTHIKFNDSSFRDRLEQPLARPRNRG